MPIAKRWSAKFLLSRKCMSSSHVISSCYLSLCYLISANSISRLNKVFILRTLLCSTSPILVLITFRRSNIFIGPSGRQDIRIHRPVCIFSYYHRLRWEQQHAVCLFIRPVRHPLLSLNVAWICASALLTLIEYPLVELSARYFYIW